MKFLWIALAALAALVAIVWIAGAMLPVKHVATRRARFRQTPQAVWSAIAREKTFREDDVDYEVTRSEPPRVLETRIAQKDLPYGGSWLYEITPGPDATELRITENGEVYNPAFRLISRFIMGHTATIDKTLHALGNKFGESITVED